MNTKIHMINIVKHIGIVLTFIGFVAFLFGYFTAAPPLFTSIGIGTIMGAVFIFLIGIFFAVTEEMVEKMDKGIKE